jgi:hypothetical protein
MRTAQGRNATKFGKDCFDINGEIFYNKYQKAQTRGPRATSLT